MIYFTVPHDVLGAGVPASDLDVYVDNGVQIPSAPPVLRYDFGDDYKLIIPTGSRVRKFSVSLSNRDADEIDIIDSYLEYLEGDPINNFHLLGVTTTFRATQWSKVYTNEDVTGMNITLEEIK